MGVACQVYAIGGWDGARYLHTVERFLPKSHEWVMVSSMKFARRCAIRRSLASTHVSTPPDRRRP